MGDSANGNRASSKGSKDPLSFNKISDLPDITHTSVSRLPSRDLPNITHTNVSRLPSRDFSKSAVGNLMTALPSVEDLKKHSDNLFNRINSGDHEAVEKLLSDRGHKVDIVPRIGCSPIHYSKFNLANWETEDGDNPLIMAARCDSKMVKIVLRYGGNPNHANNDRDTPLSIAAGRCDKGAIDALLLAGANLRAAVVKLTSLLRYIPTEEELKGYGDVANSVKPLTVLLSDDVYLKCRCPLKTAFDVGKDIANIKDVRTEFKTEFELLIEDANAFACRFMNNIDRMWEAKEILTFPVDLIRRAIDEKKKKFVSHPFCQQIIYDRWYGDLAHKMFYGKVFTIIKYFISPFLVLPLLLKFFLFDVWRGQPLMESNLASLLKLKFTPCLCFLADATNYIIFLAVLIGVCVTKQDTGVVTPWEYALYACVISRICFELDLMIQQGWIRYFANVWNQVDVLILTLLSASALYKGCVNSALYSTTVHKKIIANFTHIEKDYSLTEWSNITSHYRHFLNISYIYAATEFILFIRLLTLLEFTRSMGPMLIALKYLLLDVLKFAVVLGTTIVGTAITIHSMSVRLEKWSLDLNKQCFKENSSRPDGWKGNNSAFSSFIRKLMAAEHIRPIDTKNLSLCDGADIKIVPPDSFGGFLATVRSIMWSTFGLFDVENVTEPYEESTISFINVILVLYILLSCVLLLNMLIGVLSSTFDRIQENCDVEWKYARSELLKEYSRSQPFLIPFSTILLPLTCWFRVKLREEKERESEKFRSPAAEQEERDKIISEVCERFKFTGIVLEEESRASRQTSRQASRPGTRQERFDARVRELRRLKSEQKQLPSL